MDRAIARLILLLFLAAGCEQETDPVDEPLDPSLLLTDGFCLVSDSRVVLNRLDIDYYDLGAHLIYLKDPGAFEEKFKKTAFASVYADSTRIYNLSLVSWVASYIPQGPVIWFPSIFYPDYTVHIDLAWIGDPLVANSEDPRADVRVVAALKNYGQYRQGLQGEILSISYTAPGQAELVLELHNGDSLNYYYYDPEKMGMGRFHYFTNGLVLRDTATYKPYNHHVTTVHPDPGTGIDTKYMSVLEGESSVTLTFIYEPFDELPPGTYIAHFEFPGPHSAESREDLDLEDGRIWLGDLQLYSEVVVE